jgi:heme/copper-type cytochrome/quinol oxidase subunit 2
MLSRNKLANDQGLQTRIAIESLGFLTGAMFCLPIYMIIDSSYLSLKGNEQDFANNLIWFIFSLLLLSFVMFIWFLIYKQFKKDKTKLGYASDKKGIAVVVTAILEITVVVLNIVFFWQ